MLDQWQTKLLRNIGAGNQYGGIADLPTALDQITVERIEVRYPREDGRGDMHRVLRIEAVLPDQLPVGRAYRDFTSTIPTIARIGYEFR